MNIFKVKHWFQRLTKKQLIIAIVGVVGLIAIIITVSAIISNNKKFDVNKYYYISISGFNHYATASVDGGISQEKGIMLPTMSEIGISTTDYSSTLQFASFLSSIRMTLDKNEHISNGDVLTAKATYDQNLANALGLKVNDTISLKVENLEDGNVIDAFKDVGIRYLGSSPFLIATLQNNSQDDFLKTVEYKIMKSEANSSANSANLKQTVSNLKNGDKITVCISCYDQDKATQRKLVIADTEKEFIVESQSEYLNNTTSITDDIKQQIDIAMEEEYNDILKQYYNSDYAAFQYHDGKLISQTLLSAKQTDGISTNSNGSLYFNEVYNEIVNIYEIKRYNSLKNTDSTVYFTIEARNVNIKDGKVTITCEGSSSLDVSAKDSVEKAFYFDTQSYNIVELK